LNRAEIKLAAYWTKQVGPIAKALKACSYPVGRIWMALTSPPAQ